MKLTQKNREIIKAGIRWNAFICMGFLIGLLGIASNNIVIQANGGMPVKANIPDNTFYPGEGIHFYYGSYDSVNYFYLSDMFSIGKDVYSIGDFFIYLGVVWICTSFIAGGYFFFRKVIKINRYYNFGF